MGEYIERFDSASESEKTAAAWWDEGNPLTRQGTIIQFIRTGEETQQDPENTEQIYQDTIGKSFSELPDELRTYIIQHRNGSEYIPGQHAWNALSLDNRIKLIEGYVGSFNDNRATDFDFKKDTVNRYWQAEFSDLPDPLRKYIQVNKNHLADLS